MIKEEVSKALNEFNPYRAARDVRDALSRPALSKGNPLNRTRQIYRAKKAGRFLAGDWKNWPMEVQVNFCKKNMGKPTIKGQPAPGPTCREIMKAYKEQASKANKANKDEEGFMGPMKDPMSLVDPKDFKLNESLKISKKKLAQIIKEEVSAVLLEQDEAPTATEWLTKYPKAVQLVWKNREKLGFDSDDSMENIADFLAGKSGMVVGRGRKRQASAFLYSYKYERSEFLSYVKDVKAGRDQADAMARKRVGSFTTKADMARASQKAQSRIDALPKKLETVFPRGPANKQEALARQKAMDKLNLDKEDYNNYYTDKVVTKSQSAGAFSFDVKTLVSTRRRP